MLGIIKIKKEIISHKKKWFHKLRPYNYNNMIENLINKGFAYESNKNVYFEVRKFEY